MISLALEVALVGSVGTLVGSIATIGGQFLAARYTAKASTTGIRIETDERRAARLDAEADRLYDRIKVENSELEKRVTKLESDLAAVTNELGHEKEARSMASMALSAAQLRAEEATIQLEGARLQLDAYKMQLEDCQKRLQLPEGTQ